MILEETEEKLTQAVSLIKRLLSNHDEETNDMASAFIQDFEHKEVGYDASSLTGNEDDLPF